MVGVPMDLGGGRRGVDMGPSAVRIAGLEDAIRKLGLEYEDRGNIGVPLPESREPKNPRARFLFEIANCCRPCARASNASSTTERFRWWSAATTRSRSARSPRSARGTTAAARTSA
jgi:arginase